MKVTGIHHTAYRCKDARETVDWYKKHLGMEYVLAFAEDHVPSTHEFDPYMHIFLDAGRGNVLAFFELPNQPEMGRDENTPAWVQHLAFSVDTKEELYEAKEKLESQGIDVIGVTNHSAFYSIYFFDPNGHRLELAWNDPQSEAGKKLASVKWEMLDEWTKTKRAPKIAQWAHGQEFEGLESETVN